MEMGEKFSSYEEDACSLEEYLTVIVELKMRVKQEQI